jgi:hypothetical protein
MSMTDNYVLRKSVPDPLSRSAWRRLRPSRPMDPTDVACETYMTSIETGRMVLELLRYCRAERDGVSILVAGQRGAGKTTLVKLAIEKVVQESDGLIPLPILLHGPTLIDPGVQHEHAQADNTLVSLYYGVKAAPPEEHATPKELGLRQIIASLYRELSRVIYDAWEYAAQDSPAGRRVMSELLEMRSHLDLGLDWAPPASWLRSIWERAGFLENGVVFYLMRAKRANGGKRWQSIEPFSIIGRPVDQGIREIRALAACADAYRAIVGKTTERQEVANSDERKRQTESLPGRSPVDTGGKTADAEGGENKAKSAANRLVPPALGTIAGGLTLATQATETALLGLLVGGVVWLASWLAVSTTTHRQTSHRMQRTLTTELEWDCERIERDFPKLLARVKDAGFAPIFVLDELDKMTDTEHKLSNFLQYSKHLVTAEAAFLFLTNRDYYERLILADRGNYDNVQAKTFYTYRIFVRYEPDSYRRFLLKRFDRSNWRAGQDERLALGLMAWGTILTYRAAMLPFDFNRQLMLMVDDEGRFDDQDPDAPLRDTVYRQQIAMQLAIEIITREPAVKERMKELPYYSQHIYDTLYYIRQLHEKEQTTTREQIKITPESMKEYLWSRAQGKEEEEMPDSFIPSDEETFLFDLLRRYIELLANPRQIRREIVRFAQGLKDGHEDPLLNRRLWLAMARAIDDRPIVQVMRP